MTVEALKRMTEVDYDPFATAEVVRSFPTTDAQREIWLAAELGREATLAYNESVSLVLRGALDVAPMRAAVQALTDRHEALRATFDAEGAGMLVAARIDMVVDLIDLSAIDAASREQRLAALRVEAVETPFDLLNGPLIRAVLVRTGADAHELILTAHHIVCDGWSFGVLCRDLMSLYRHHVAGNAKALIPPADTFGDYALSELDPEQLRARDADEKYWVSLFDRGQPVLDLPTDRPRGHQRTFASRRIDYVLPPRLVEAARQLGAKQGVSLFATLFGVFAALMQRLGSEGEVVVGVPAAGQSTRGLDNLVGHCVNVLPVPVSVEAGDSVGKLLKHAGSRMLDAYDHQSSTFGSLLTKLNVRREANRLPLVSVLFNIDAAIPSSALSMERLAVSLSSNPRAFENFELFVNASQTDHGVVLETQYHSALFDAETVERWLKLYEAALERAIADPSRPVVELFSATAGDRDRLGAFNETASSYKLDDRIEALVARQAARTPDAIAVVSGSERLTYRELDERSNAVAHALLARGAGPGKLVGMACGRNVNLLPAMLGILKTGAAYVPLDPDFPEERLGYMCADAEIRCVVADRSVRPIASEGVAVVLADELAPEKSPLPAVSDAMAPAYVIYTSGSTGKPKGVVVHHQAVVNFLASMAREPGLTASDRLVAVTTTSFDIAVLELLLPLTVGAQTILADRETVLDGPALRKLIERHEATVLQATPAGWRLLVDAGWNGSSKFKALVGGEALPADLADELSARAGEVWNMYGPTETTVWSACWKLPRERDGIRIGAPIANTIVLVFDEAMQCCPIGVPGEIFIGGDGVATGYWRRPELTAERFMIVDGSRVYRTGDRGRWRNDGTLEHLGRLDFQVKVRGYRIELGEIETALARHDAVERVVVIAREDEPGDVRLVAYVVAAAGKTIDPEAMRSFLRLSLPEYMVPAHVMALPAIPLLPNGKVNRKALPAPQMETRARAVGRSPSTPTEAAVLKAMEEILRLPGLGLDEDFFSAGGHSLLAARLTAQLNKTFGLALPLRTVFQHSSADALARAIDAAKQGGSAAISAARVPVQSNQSTGPLTEMQERVRFMEELHPGRVVYNTPSAHRLKGPFDLAAFNRAFQSVLARQPGLRTQIEVGPEGPRQRVVDLSAYEIPFEDLSSVDEAARETVLREKLQEATDQPIDIHSAPLFRAAIFRLAPEEHALLFVPHHIIWDGWSFDLLYTEMAAFYPAALEGRVADLPPLPVSYLDYAYWHRGWMSGDECRRQTAYWRQRFAGLETPGALPTDHPRRAGMTGEGRVEWVAVDRELTERLRQVAMDLGATLNMLVMAVYVAQMAQATSGNSIVVGVPVRGRTVSEVEPLMGFFNNLLPMPLTVRPELQLSAWVAAVKADLIDVFAHQDVPFERLALEDEIARHANRGGLYHTLFSFQDGRERPVHWGPLSHSRIPLMQKGATEDLGFWLIEVPDGLEGGVNYNADVFDESTARMFRERILGMLRRVAERPGETLGALLDAPGPDRDAFAQWLEGRQAQATEAVVSGRARSPEDADETSADWLPLAEIWAELLGIDASDIDGGDNFFDLGGSSLLVMRAVERARQQLGLNVDPSRYVHETVSQLAVVSDEPSSTTNVPEATGGVAQGAATSGKVMLARTGR